MFDLKDTIEFDVITQDGDKTCELRHPTDEQWVERFSKRYTLIRNLGNGSTEQKSMNKEVADAALLAAIQVNKAAASFDDYEAVTIIDQLATCDVVDVSRNGGSIVITLSTILGEVTHHAKMPGMKDLRYAIEAAVKVRGGRLNTSTVTIFLPSAADLYDKIAESVEGYSTKDPKQVPIIHKYKVIDVIQGEISNITAKAKVKSNNTDLPTSPGQTTQV